MGKLDSVVKQVQVCRLCPLCRARTSTVPGEGSESAAVMFIGEGPGYHEDREGRPFIGPAGQFLDELLGLAGLRRADVYITNVVKCRPPNNRDPLPAEINACAPYLDRQIATINPRVIVTLGRYSMARFVDEGSISRIHGRAWTAGGRLVVTMYHPAAGLHNEQLKDVIREDFRKLGSYVEQARQVPPPATQPPALEPPADAAAVLEAYAARMAAALGPLPTEPAPPAANGHTEPPAALTAPASPVGAPIAEAEPAVVVDAPPEVLRPRRSRARRAASPAPEAPSVPEPEVAVSDLIDPAPAVSQPAEEAAAEIDIAVAVLDEAPAAPDAADAPPRAVGRKKSKPAPEAEQLALF